MTLKDRYIEFVKRENLFQRNDVLLLAVSGGLDSVALCELCFQSGYRFAMAHCNFKLRGNESERDEKFVVSLAKKYNVELRVKAFDTATYATENKLSIQEAARKLRYDWFYEMLIRKDAPLQPEAGGKPIANFVLTAHHADDNLETMLMNFFRGTGVHGLRGILPKQDRVIRPLLVFRKEELHQFARGNSLEWVEDSSNQSGKYSRNHIRNHVIPLIKQIYPETEQNLLHNLQRFADIEILYNQSIDRHKEKLLEVKGNEVHIPVLKLKKAQPLTTIIHEIIGEYNFTVSQINEVIRLLESNTGKYIQSSSHRIIKNRNWLIIGPRATQEAANIIIETPDTDIPFELGQLRLQLIRHVDHPADSMLKYPDKLSVQLDAAEIIFPLLLRKWKTGDYFYPLGMKKKKKLSRFFIDQKLSKVEKENCWVLEMNKKIIWVVGHRIDDRFRVTSSTRESLLVTLKRQQPAI